MRRDRDGHWGGITLAAFHANNHTLVSDAQRVSNGSLRVRDEAGSCCRTGPTHTIDRSIPSQRRARLRVDTTAHQVFGTRLTAQELDRTATAATCDNGPTGNKRECRWWLHGWRLTQHQLFQRLRYAHTDMSGLRRLHPATDLNARRIDFEDAAQLVYNPCHQGPTND